MSVKIRLRRTGSSNRPFYRVVVADIRNPVKGRFIENVGWYDPKQAGVNYALKTDRIEYWASQGAQLSDTVKSLVKQSRNPAQAAPNPSKPAPKAPVTPPAAETEATQAEAERAAEETAPGEEPAPVAEAEPAADVAETAEEPKPAPEA